MGTMGCEYDDAVAQIFYFTAVKDSVLGFPAEVVLQCQVGSTGVGEERGIRRSGPWVMGVNYGPLRVKAFSNFHSA